MGDSLSRIGQCAETFHEVIVEDEAKALVEAEALAKAVAEAITSVKEAAAGAVE